MTFPLEVKVDFICSKGIFNSTFTLWICNGDIYHIELKKWTLYVVKAYLIQHLHYGYVLETFIILNWKT